MITDRRWRWGAACLAGWLLAAAADWGPDVGAGRVARAAPGIGAEEVPAEVRVPVSARLSRETVVPGGDAVLAVVYEVPPDAHIQVNDFLYAQPKEGEPFLLGEPRRSPTTMFEGEPVHVGRTTVWYRVRFSPDLPVGQRELRLAAGYQACIERPVFACFAPTDLELSLPVEIVPAGSPTRASDDPVFASLPGDLPEPAGASAGVAPASDQPESPALAPGETVGALPGASAGPAPSVETPAQGGLAGRLQQALKSRSILAFLLVFVGGILTSFTPCVYPMIPITISYIGGQAKGRAGGFVLSLFFVFGIAVMYSVLGVLAASTGALFGSAMQSTPFLIVVSVVFFAMGASMLGLFDLALPSGVQTKLQSGPRTGLAGALFMGMVTGIVASPCVGPVLVVLLTEIARMGSIALGFVYLFVFALGLGVLFLVIGTFAGALAALPQAGGWMDTVKHLFGVVLIGMGIFYLRGLLGPVWTSILFGAYAVVVGTFAGAFHPLEADPPRSRLLRKAVGILLVLVGSFTLLGGLARQAGWSRAAGGTIAVGGGAEGRANAGGGARAHAGPNWVMDDAAGLAQARAEGKPAFIDFYADWCAACKELDHKTWSDAEVMAEAGRFVAIKLDFTRRNPANAAKQASYGVAGLPTVVFYDSSGCEVTRFFGFKPATDVLAILRGVR